MKKYLLIIVTGVFYFHSYGQEALEVQYEYDNAGNRIARYVIVLEDDGTKSFKRNKQSDNSTDETYYIDNLDDISLKIFPNPTNSYINIQIDNIFTEINGFISIYSTSGSKIFTDNINTTNKRIDLSNYPNGVYLVNISINGKETTWKVVKK
jgi:hypothetical protein